MRPIGLLATIVTNAEADAVSGMRPIGLLATIVTNAEADAVSGCHRYR